MRDLRNELTVFVISVGNINFEDCLVALNKQSCSFKLELIQGICPMSVAFQEMLNRCTTDYFIQVDEDMVLNYLAIETMYDNFNQEVIASNKYYFNSKGESKEPLPDKKSMDCYYLKDVHLDKMIYGVKIYKTDFFKKYPYNVHHPSCEVEQLDRMWNDGYYYRLMYDCLGEHSPKWSKDAIFERYYNLFHKYKIYKYSWIGRLLPYLRKKYDESKTDVNFYAIAGALCAIYEKNPIDKEKNASLRNEYMEMVDEYL